MKSLIMLIAFLSCAVMASAQEDAIQKYFARYSDDDRFTSVYVSNKMFSMFSDIDDSSDRELADVMSKLGGLRVLTSDNTEGMKMYKDAHRLLVTNGFEELMDVKEKTSSEFKFLIREVNGRVRELLMLSGGEKNFFLMSLIGDIDLKKISRLSKEIHVDGMENLEKLKNAKQSDKK
jgi:Domain of unknown function (DUF4252)